MKERILFKVRKVLEAWQEGKLSWWRASYMLSILAEQLEAVDEETYYLLTYVAGGSYPPQDLEALTRRPKYGI